MLAAIWLHEHDELALSSDWSGRLPDQNRWLALDANDSKEKALLVMAATSVAPKPFREDQRPISMVVYLSRN